MSSSDLLATNKIKLKMGKSKRIGTIGVNMTSDDLVIMASAAFSPGKDIVQRDLTNIRDCGFNAIELGPSETQIGKVMDNSSKTGFSMIEGTDLYSVIRSDTLTDQSQCQQYVENYKDRPNLLGWSMGVCPTYNVINSESFKNWMACMRKVRSATENDAPVLMFIQNKNMPSFISDGSYGSYLNRLKELFTFKGYDDKGDYIEFYPEIWVNTLFGVKSSGGKTIVDADFYAYLESFASVTKSDDEKFWSVCRCVGISAPNYGLDFPAPTKASMMFEAFSALAYGAQGLVFYGYADQNTQELEDEEVTYSSSPIDSTGNIDYKVWHDVQEVNTMINKYSSIFKDCVVDRVAHSGDEIPSGTTGISFPFGPLLSMISKSAGVLASLIEKKVQVGVNSFETEKYLILVNHDIVNSQSVSLLVDANRTVSEVTPTKMPNRVNRLMTTNGYALLFSKNLAPGGFAIYRWK